MVLLADYEGLQAAVGLTLGLIALAPALLLGILGAVAAARVPPYRILARWLSGIGLFIALAAIVFAGFGVWADRNDVNAHGENFYPPAYCYLAAIVTLWANVYALYGSFRQPASATPDS